MNPISQDTSAEKRTMSSVLEETRTLTSQLFGLLLSNGLDVKDPLMANQGKLLTGVVSLHIDLLEKINDDLRIVIREAHLLK